MQTQVKSSKDKHQKPHQQQPQKVLPFDKWVLTYFENGRKVNFSAQRGMNLIEALSLTHPDATDFKSVWVDANTRLVENVVGEQIGEMTR
jgi:hypothetical protein